MKPITTAAAAALTALLTALATVAGPVAASPRPGHSPGPSASASPSQLPSPVVSAGRPHRGHHHPHGTTAAPPAAAASGPQLSIAVTDGRTSVREGDQVTYTVRLHNIGRHSARRLRLTQTLPSSLKVMSASRRPATRPGTLTWQISLPAGHTDTFRVTGRVGHTPGQLLRLATVVCASTGSSTRPIVCGAHSDELPAGAVAAAQAGRAASTATSQRTRMQILRPVAAGAGLLVMIVITVLLIRRRRRVSTTHQAGPS